MNYESLGFVGGGAANEYAGTRLRDLKNIQIERKFVLTSGHRQSSLPAIFALTFTHVLGIRINTGLSARPLLLN